MNSTQKTVFRTTILVIGLVIAGLLFVHSGFAAQVEHPVESGNPEGITLPACNRALMPVAFRNAGLPSGGALAVTSYRGPMADFNGDGCADLAIGAPGKDNAGIDESGAVFVVFGAVGNWLLDPAVRSLGQPDGFIDERFGDALGFGDFNADGYSDLAVGIPGKTVGASHAGQVRVYYGSPIGIIPGEYEIFDQIGLIDFPEAGDGFGSALTGGDFNGDGYDDLAVGAPDEDYGGFNDAGVVHIIFGSEAGLTTDGNLRFAQDDLTSGDLGTGDRFGTALAAGDFNADGFDDLAIGSPEESIAAIDDTGMVDILYGSESNFGDNDQIIQQNMIGEMLDEFDLFGAALAVGDFNGDGFADLAISSPGETVAGQDSAGRVHILFGSITALSFLSAESWDQTELPGTPEAGDRFGFDLVAADFNGDSVAELAIGIPGENFPALPAGGDDAGAVQVLYFEDGDFAAQTWSQESPGIAGEGETGDHFGYALTAGDYNGDGIRDLAVGVPYDHYEPGGVVPEAGEVNVILGSLAGLIQDGSVRIFNALNIIPGTSVAEDWFGLAIR